MEEIVKKMILGSRVLYFGTVWPEPTSSAAGVRVWSLVKILKDSGASVVFASASKMNEWTERLGGEGVDVLPVGLNDSGLDSELARLRPDLVIFDRFVVEEQFGWRVRAVCPEAMRVLETQDLHFLRRARESLVTESLRTSPEVKDDPQPPGGVEAELHISGSSMRNDDTWRELASIHRSDLTLVCSDFESELLAREWGVASEAVHLFRFAYPAPAAGTAGFATRRGFSMIGNFRHAPNLDGVQWFVKEIWPRVLRRMPGAEVSLYGAYPPREVMELSGSQPGLVVHGHAADVSEVLSRPRVNMAPLRFGAGVKGKILEGWRVGTPCVSTSVGAEGICGGLPFGGEVADGADDFAAAMIALHEDERRWSTASEAGLRLIRKVHAESVQAPALLRVMASRLAGLRDYRERNIVGSILWHQSLRATEYFSRWIEEKNRVGFPK